MSEKWDTKSRDANWNHFFKSPIGKRIFAEMMTDMGFNQPMFDADPQEMAARARMHDIMQKWINRTTFTASRIHEIVVQNQMDEMRWNQEERRANREETTTFSTPTVKGVA